MTKHVLTTCALVLALGAVTSAQDDDAARRTAEVARRETTITPLKVDIVLSRLNTESGETVSSLPYTLLVNANDGKLSTLNMGAEVPVRGMTNIDGKLVPGSINYRPIGTQINCVANSLGDGKFALELRIEESSVYDEDDPDVPGAPVFRTFRISNNLMLRDGQSVEFTAAADRISGEVVRAEVSLEVLD